MKTQEQMNYEFATRQLLQMVPGGQGWYVAGNGRLTQVRPGAGGGGGRAGQAQQGGRQLQQGAQLPAPLPVQQGIVQQPAPEAQVATAAAPVQGQQQNIA